MFSSAMTVLLRDAPCAVHGARCSYLKNGCGLIHLAGSPCVDYSEMGNGEGVAGHTIAYFLTWAAIRRKVQEPVIIHECVREFCEWLLLDELPMYFIDYIVLSPSDLGWPIARQRSWCVSLG